MKWVQAARCYLAGLFGSLFLPSLIGGDLVRAGMAMRIGRSKAGVLLGSLVDRSVDLVALGLLAGIGALLVPGSLDPKDRRILLQLARDWAGWNRGRGGHRRVSSRAPVFLSYEAAIRAGANRCAFDDTTPGGSIHGAQSRSVGADSVHHFEYGFRGGMRIALGVSSVVVCVASGEAFGGASAHSGRNRCARSSACCSAVAIWSARGSIGRCGNCLGSDRDWRRSGCRTSPHS